MDTCLLTAFEPNDRSLMPTVTADAPLLHAPSPLVKPLCMLPLRLQMVKPLERNTRYVDAVMTIPKGTLYPMCGMNLAFDRMLIGPAMYFGLMGEGQPIGRYDDMWAGWCSKVSSRRGRKRLMALHGGLHTCALADSKGEGCRVRKQDWSFVSQAAVQASSGCVWMHVSVQGKCRGQFRPAHTCTAAAYSGRLLTVHACLALLACLLVPGRTCLPVVT